MGNVCQGIRQVTLILRKPLRLLPQAHRHFINLIAQNIDISLAEPAQLQMRIAVQDLINLFVQPAQLLPLRTAAVICICRRAQPNRKTC